MNELKITYSHKTRTEVLVEDSTGPLTSFTFQGILFSYGDECVLFQTYKQDPRQVENVVCRAVVAWFKHRAEHIKV